MIQPKFRVAPDHGVPALGCPLSNNLQVGTMIHLTQTILRVLIWMLCASTVLIESATAQIAGGGGGQPGGQPGQGIGNIGGILVDAEGVVRPVFVKEKTGKLEQKRRAELAGKSLPSDLNSFNPLRKVSLVRLEAACEAYAERQEHVAAEMQYLAGLQRIDYVFVYPDEKDIVIAGPAEGFATDGVGRAVGVSTARPPLRLDDLLVAVRALVRGGTLGCSIDPVESNLAELKDYITKNTTPLTPDTVKARYEQFRRILGMHNVRVFGISADSHFAEVLVEADYRMKRLSMGLDPAGVKGFKSHLAMLGPGANMMQRWWFTPLYNPFTKSADGLAFQFSGQRLQLMAQNEIVSDSGQFRDASLTRATEEKFARHFTDKFPELADANPVFAELQNLVDLAIVAALLKKERLPEKVGWTMSLFLDADRATIAKRPVPKRVAATMNYKSGSGKVYIGLVGGGVTIDPARTVLRNEFRDDSDGKLEASRTSSALEQRPEKHPWWWD